MLASLSDLGTAVGASVGLPLASRTVLALVRSRRSAGGGANLTAKRERGATEWAEIRTLGALESIG